MFSVMMFDKARLKAIAFSLLKYYGVVICAFLVAVPLFGLVGLIHEYLSEFVTSPETFDAAEPFLFGIICIVIGFPFLIGPHRGE